MHTSTAWARRSPFIPCLVALLAGSEGEVQPVSLDVTREPINTDVSVTALPAPGDAPANVTWLGCLQLRARAGEAFFGGISGLFVRGSRVLMVSDSTQARGSGRFFIGDIELGPADELGGELLVPIDVPRLTVQPLRDEDGELLLNDKHAGDLEGLGVRWPEDAASPVRVLTVAERVNLIRAYEAPSAGIDPDTSMAGVTPTLVGGHIGREVMRCRKGPEGLAFVTDRTFVVFCEENDPASGRANETLGWLADETGRVLGTYIVPRPEVPGAAGTFMRVSEVAAVPGNASVLFLFHYWRGDLGSAVVISHAALPLDGGSASAPAVLEPSALVGPLRDHDGFPIDNMEAMSVTPTSSDGAYVIHILSDNNFNEGQQTYLLSLLMRDNSPARTNRARPEARLGPDPFLAAAAAAGAISVAAAVCAVAACRRARAAKGSPLVTSSDSDA